MIRVIVACVLSASALLVAPSESKAVSVSDANGVVLGDFVSISTEYIVFTTSTGFLGYVDPISNKLARPPFTEGTYYLGSDCTGQAYAIGSLVRPVVFGSTNYPPAGEGVFYLAVDAATITLSVGQIYSFWSSTPPNPAVFCSSRDVQPGDLPQLVPVSPNDPNVTGLPSGPFLPPFKLTMRSIFEDGFDGVVLI